MRKRKTYTRRSAQTCFFGGYNLAVKTIKKEVEQLRSLHSCCPITEETYKLVLSVVEKTKMIPKTNPSNNIKICLQKKN